MRKIRLGLSKTTFASFDKLLSSCVGQKNVRRFEDTVVVNFMCNIGEQTSNLPSIFDRLARYKQ